MWDKACDTVRGFQQRVSEHRKRGVLSLKSGNRVLSWFVIKDDKQDFKSEYVYNKHNTTCKVLCTVFRHSFL